jgi:hypothetical protein
LLTLRRGPGGVIALVPVLPGVSGAAATLRAVAVVTRLLITGLLKTGAQRLVELSRRRAKDSSHIGRVRAGLLILELLEEKGKQRLP